MGTELKYVYAELARKQAEADREFVERLDEAISKVAAVKLYLGGIIQVAESQRAIERSASPYGRKWAIETIAKDYREALAAIIEMRIAIGKIDPAIESDGD
jgi:hypothetical protein